MNRASPQDNLLPSAFVKAAARQSRELFLSAWGDTLFLLVKLEDAAGDLAHGLANASTLTGEKLNPSRDALGYATVMDGSANLPGQLRPSVAPSTGSYDTTKLQTQLLRAPRFAVPLRKRPSAGKPFVERISVGRAPNNDVVLRNGSVSKFHAWLECDEHHVFYVCDAHSKNGTTLNGEPVESVPVAIRAGDELQFGQVQVIVCPPDLLWEVAAIVT